MPHINDLPVLERPVTGTDTVIIETPEGTRRLAAIEFKGDQGEHGLKGDQGETGLKGDQGLKGDKGLTGDQGEQGETGLKGDQGLTGTPGLKGDQGEQGTPGTATGTREIITLTSASLGNGQSEKGVFSLATSFEILRVELSGTARVRLYNTEAARDADFGRSIYAAPTWGAGLILDINAVAILDQSLDPHAHGSNMEAVASNNIAYTVTNSGATGSISIDFTILRKEQ